jgi:hypothetical protein
VSTLQRPLLLLDISTKQRPELYLERVWRTGACAGLDMSILHNIGPELHLHLSTLQRPLLHLGVFTPQGPKLHLDLYGQKEPVLTLDVSTP